MAKRKSINWAGFKHENPIPNASMIGNILMSSVISGRDPETHTMPPDAEAQVANIFKQIRACVEAAGGTVDDILKVNFWVKDPAVGRKMLNGPWTQMFPDAASRQPRAPDGLGETATGATAHGQAQEHQLSGLQAREPDPQCEPHR